MSSPQPAQRPLAGLSGSAFAVFVGIGWSLGVAPLAAYGTIAEDFHTPATYAAIWTAGLTYALIAAVAMSRAADRGGGYYAVAQRGLGDWAGFAVGVAEWAAICGASAAAATLAGEFAVGLVPQARAGEVVALALILAFTAVAWFGARAGAVLQSGMGVLAVIAVAAFAVGAFWLGSRSPVQQPAISAESDSSLVVPLLVALQAAMIAMSGWAGALYSSEGRMPIGRRIALTAAAVAAVHAIANVAVMHVVSLPTIAGSEIAVETAAGRLLGGAYDGVRVLLIVVLACATSAGVLMAPKVVETMAQDRLIWRGIRAEAAVLVSSVLVAALVVTGGFRGLLAALAVMLFAIQALAFVSVAVESRTWDGVRVAAVVGAALAAGVLGTMLVTRPARALPLLMIAAALPLLWAVRRRGAHRGASLAIKSGSESRFD